VKTSGTRLRPRVLIADDEQETCVLLRAYLEQEGIEVVGTASGGAGAVEMADELAPDIVLMDLRMPDMDGVEATRRIEGANPDVKVIFLTFYGDAGWTEKAEDVGAFGYLVKGCPPSMIVDMIRRAWNQKRSAGDRPSSVGG
jgi:DNA-binding NarL/FixJ family response regulator